MLVSWLGSWHLHQMGNIEADTHAACTTGRKVSGSAQNRHTSLLGPSLPVSQLVDPSLAGAVLTIFYKLSDCLIGLQLISVFSWQPARCKQLLDCHQHIYPCHRQHWLALTSLTPIFLQAARKLSTFLRHLAADSLG